MSSVTVTKKSGMGTGVAFLPVEMSTPTAAPTVKKNLPVSDYALDQIGAAMTVDAKIQAARAKAKAAREAAEKADEEAASFGTNRRTVARQNDRRALLVGRVILARAVVDQTVWADVWPELVASLAEASDEDRALVGLPPVVAEKPVEKAQEQPVVTGKSDEKTQDSPAPVPQVGKNDEQPVSDRLDGKKGDEETENEDGDEATGEGENAPIG